MNQINGNQVKSLVALRILEQALANVPDQRSARGIRYGLLPLLMVVMLAKLANADTPIEIADWGEGHADWLREHLKVKWKRMPHHSTYRRLLQRSASLPDLRAQAQVFLSMLQSPQECLYNLDGKTLRGTVSAEETRGTHLLAIQQAGTNAVLAQMPVGDKENEISAAPGLLKTVDLSGKIVSGDAMHTQRELSRQIVEAGGDYLWFVKRNQSVLHDHLASAFGSAASRLSDSVAMTELDKGHGRLERRQITVSGQVMNTFDWPYAAQAFVLYRTRTVSRTGKDSTQIVYGITSLEPMKAQPADLMRYSRQHWNIENGLHRRRDVTFKEDFCRQKSAQAAECLAIFNNLAIGLLRWMGWANLARARRCYSATLMRELKAIQCLSP